MASLCDQCGSEVGFFGGKKVKLADGREQRVCKKCSRLAAQPAPAPESDDRIVSALEVVLEPDPTPPAPDPAIAAQLEALRSDPGRVDALLALRAIYVERNQVDEAWCVCRALAFLRAADADAAQLFERHRRGSVRVRARMTDASWRRMTHPAQDRFITAVLFATDPAATHARKHEHFGFRPKDRLDPAESTLLIAKTLGYVGQALSVDMPEVYVSPAQPEPFQLANCQAGGRVAPAFVLGAGLLSGRSAPELMFWGAYHLSFLRAGHYAALALPTPAQLRAALYAAITMVRPDVPAPPDVDPQALATLLAPLQRRISRQVRKTLEPVVTELLRATHEPDVAAWRRAVTATADRAGFVLCDDLDVAAAQVAAMPVAQGDAPASQRIAELVWFSVSEDYFSVRRELGLGLDV